ncbi:hypothetical protein HY485_01820 [Candidatus Woesearchaeota archaeon]|nr:hypothetical protein [Candidatus Woesearchaeota archaeon]
MVKTGNVVVGVGLLGILAYLAYDVYGRKTEQGSSSLSSDQSASIKDIARAKGLTSKDLVQKQISEALAQKQFEMAHKTNSSLTSGLDIVRPDIAQEVRKSDEVHSLTSSGQMKMVSPFTGQVSTVREVFRESPVAAQVAQNIVQSAQETMARGGTTLSGAQASATSLTGTGQFGVGLVTQRAKQAASKAKKR